MRSETYIKRKRNIPMTVFAVLFCLTIISFYFTGSLFAKFAASNTIQASAKIAIMAADKQVPIEDVYVSPGSSTDLLLTLTNKQNGKICEVKQEYSVTVNKMSENIPLTCKIYKQELSGMTEVNNISGTFNAGIEESAIYKVVINWPQDLPPAEMSTEIDWYEITVDTTQID